DETLRFRCRHRPRRIVDGWRVREEGPGAAATRSNGSAGGDQAGAAAAPTTAAAGAEAASADRRRALRQEDAGAAQCGEAAGRRVLCVRLDGPERRGAGQPAEEPAVAQP